MTSISQIDKHLKKEFEDWEKIQQKELGKLISAKRHLCVNIGAYLLISVIEGILSSISGSQTLKADAFNNLSGIISTVLLIIGIHIASDIDDDDIAGIPLPKISLRKTGNDQRIQFTRWRYETIFTLVTGIIMIVIASSVIIDGIKEVDELKAHYNGNLITLDVVVIVDGTMSVLESYRLGEKIESLMLKNFGIIDTDVSFIPDSASDENEHKNRIRRNRNRF